MTIAEIENAWKQAENVWKINSNRLLSLIPYEERGTNNKNDQLGDLIAQISIKVSDISFILRSWKKVPKEIITKKNESLFDI